MGSGASKKKDANLEALADPGVAKVLKSAGSALDDDQVLKIAGQLEFASAEGKELPARAQSLLAELPAKTVQVPKVRFGRTELMMPLVTMGGMRLQQTWVPDTTPVIGISSMSSITKPCQENFLACIRRALSHGINHFETARFYGTSEMQYCDALATLIENGEVKREDIIVQTKVVPSSTNAEFRKALEDSWRNCARLGYIDLFSFHGVSSEKQLAWTLEADDGKGNMSVAEEWKAKGRIRFIGFSTHGMPQCIEKCIETDKFDYVNLHFHFFGDYHAAGCPDGAGGQGNERCVALANARDMGVFVISPIDKGGALYQPTSTVARLVGDELSPIAFAALWLWRHATSPSHTLSIGVARPSDFDEIVAAASRFADDATLAAVRAAETRLRARAREKLGDEWADGWWKGLPDLRDARARGVAVAHVVWLHGLVSAYGMWDFARARYAGLEGAKWKKGRSDAENIDEWTFNPGRAFDASVDLAPALAECADAARVLAAVHEGHAWLHKGRAPPDDAERRANGWTNAYQLKQWESFPGDSPTVISVVTAHVTHSPLGGQLSPTGKQARRNSLRARSSFVDEVGGSGGKK